MTAKRRLYLIYFCFFVSQLFNSVHSNSQQLRYNFKNYTPSDGLPSSEVYQVLQDANHYMWFATDHGVCRYNGYAFETFNLPDNSILGLYEDVKKRIWAYSFSGQLFYYQKGKFQEYKWNKELMNALKPGVINSIYVDSTDVLHVSASGPSYYRISSKGIVENLMKVGRRAITTSFQISANDYFTGILTYPEKYGLIIKPFESITELNFLSWKKNIKITIPFVLQPERCRTKIFSNDELFLFSKNGYVNVSKNGDFKAIQTTFSIDDIEEIDGNYYFATEKGLIIRNKKGNVLSEYFHGLHITSLEKDYENGLWISTLANGVFYLNHSRIKHLSRNGKVIDKKIKVLLKLKDSTVLAAVQGNELINFKTDSFFESIRLDVIDIASLYQYRSDTILVGSSMGFKPDLWENNRIIKEKGLTLMRIPNNSNFIIKNQKLYSGITTNILEYNLGNLKLPYIESAEKFRVSKLFLTRNNEVLVGNQFGLWNYRNGTLYPYDTAKQILSSRITDIEEYKHQFLCLGTRGKGLLLMQNDSIFQIASASGLISDNIRRIFIDDNHIWLATNQGISILTINSDKPLSYSIRNISVQDGLLSNEVNDIISYGNEMIVATNSGISFLDKNVLFTKEVYRLPFYITGLKLNGVTIDSTQLQSISYKKRNLSVSFEALNFSNPGKNNYRYRLLGFDTSWLYTNDLKVQFNPLPYGTYQLQIQAKREYDLWGPPEDGLMLVIQCSPPFWTTGWFFAIILSAVSFLFFLFYKQRIKLVKKRQEEKEDLQRRIAETEQMALKSQMNPHFIFNSLNSIQQYVIEGDVEGANSFISGFSKLIRQTLEFSSKDRITLDEEISYLKNYLQLEKNKMEDIFQYEVTIQTRHSLTDISIPPLLLQPYVENAVRHGVRSLKNKEGIIHLFFIEHDDVLECRIEDNGIGRERALQLKSRNPIEYQSKGMSLTANRVELLNKTMDRSIQIIVDDLKSPANNASGTRVTVLFPA